MKCLNKKCRKHHRNENIPVFDYALQNSNKAMYCLPDDKMIYGCIRTIFAFRSSPENCIELQHNSHAL
jgi:hypothetical protein